MMPDGKPDWLVDGAEVVVIYAHGLSQSANKTRIKKVSKTSFTIEGLPIRFRTRDQRSNYEHRRLVVPIDSAEGKKALAKQEREYLMNKIGILYLRWERDPNEPKRLELIEALQALAPKEEGS
jgi:hypothetical protein